MTNNKYLEDTKKQFIQLDAMKTQLAEMYNKRKVLGLELKQIYDDIELLETMIIYKFNQIKNKNDERKNTSNDWIRNHFTSNR